MLNSNQVDACVTFEKIQDGCVQDVPVVSLILFEVVFRRVLVILFKSLF